MTEGDRLSAIERLNTISAEQAHRRAEQTRAETIDLAYEALLLHLQADQDTFNDLEERDLPEGEEVGLFVGEDMLAVLTSPDENQRTFSILLVEEVDLVAPDEEDLASVDEETADEDAPTMQVKRLKIHVPVGNDIHIEDFEMPDPKDVDTVYLEYSLDDSPPLRYAVTRQWMHEYTSAADPGGEASPLSVEEFLRRTGTTVDEGVITITQAFSNIVNMKAVPQRYITVGKPGVRDA